MLPSNCPECGTELDWSQTQTQSKCGPYAEVTVTWNWDTVHCPKCGYVESMCSETNLKLPGEL